MGRYKRVVATTESRKRKAETSTGKRKSTKLINGKSAAFSTDKCRAFFQSYIENDSDCIGPEGILRLCGDLGIESTDVVTLALCWLLDAERQGYFTMQEWMRLETLRCDELGKLKAALSTLRMYLKDDVKLKKVFGFCFNFFKENPQKKTLDTETVTGILPLLLGDWWGLELFLEFLSSHDTERRCLNRDEWNNVIEFALTVDEDLRNYDPTGAWPVMLDDFVAFAQSKIV